METNRDSNNQIAKERAPIQEMFANAKLPSKWKMELIFRRTVQQNLNRLQCTSEVMKPQIVRCWDTENPLYIRYHDEEWGVPVHDDKKLFELLVLEGFQAGLTWALILKRREALRKAFADFNPKTIAKFSTAETENILENPNVIRNKAKIHATINNATRFIQIQNEFGSFDRFIWQFVHGKPIDHAFKSMSEMPPQTDESRAMSKELKRRGFKFVGPTICYAFMQAVGMVNDHLITCFRHNQIQKQTKTHSSP